MNLNTKITRMGKVRKVSGQLGIEIECEVRNELDRPWHSTFWQLHSDGSLRGVGYEFVLSSPIQIKDLDVALKEWSSLCDAHRIRFVDSKRTSVHVHCNVQDYTILQVINIVCAYWLCEPMLLNICGEERKGNLFCLGLDRADTVHSQLVKNLKEHKFFQGFSREAFRYASINLEALYKFGSLEFRSMRGTQDISLIGSWARELHHLVTNAAKAKSPHVFLELLNEGKHKKFLRKLFTESFTDQLIKATGHSWRNILNSRAMYVMDLLHARENWDPIKDEQDEKKGADNRNKVPGVSTRGRYFYVDIDGRTWCFDPLWDPGPHGLPIIQGVEVGTVRTLPATDQPNGRRWQYWDGRSYVTINQTSRMFRQIVGLGHDLFWSGFRYPTHIHADAIATAMNDLTILRLDPRHLNEAAARGQEEPAMQDVAVQEGDVDHLHTMTATELWNQITTERHDPEPTTVRFADDVLPNDEAFWRQQRDNLMERMQAELQEGLGQVRPPERNNNNNDPQV